MRSRLAAKVAARTEDGWDRVVAAIMAVLRTSVDASPSESPRSPLGDVGPGRPDGRGGQSAVGDRNIQVVGNGNIISSAPSTRADRDRK